MLSTQALHTMGLPNRDGVLVIGNALINVTYVDDSHISAWADVDYASSSDKHPFGWLEMCVVM